MKLLWWRRLCVAVLIFGAALLSAATLRYPGHATAGLGTPLGDRGARSADARGALLLLGATSRGHLLEASDLRLQGRA